MSNTDSPKNRLQIPVKTLKMTRPLIDAFGDLTDDHNPLHFDDDMARARGYPAAIAHGAIAASLLFAMMTDWLGDWPLPQDEIDLTFIAPVFTGDWVTAGGEVEFEEDEVWQCSLWCKTEDGKLLIVGKAQVHRGRDRS